ncbi:MAG: hypothetical protein Q9227_001577 [Pyrenula ochraceoflavens]
MAELETNVASHYNLTNPYPVEWPAELEESDEEDASKSTLNVRKSRSRYSALEPSASTRRSVIPGSQKTGDGRANLVQKDEPDPLGGSDSVVKILRQRGLPVDDDSRLRNKFMLSSTTFSPPLFLSQVHSKASTQALLGGLDSLSQSIDQKSASLKVLVESNFERFVRAKATIDNVYTEMRNQGSSRDPSPSRPQSPGARRAARASAHFRNFSGNGGPGALNQNPAPKKNALVKESEYGILGIKNPLLEVAQKAEDVWGPALGGKERETTLKAVTNAVTKDRPLYELGANLSRSIKQKNYEAIVEQYNMARSYANGAKDLAERTTNGRQQLSDDEVHHIIVTGRMWMDAEEQIKKLKREVWRRLSNVQSVLPSANGLQQEEHMELISLLLELGVEDNPIWVWLLSRYDYLKNKITAVSERSKVEIEITRRRLANAEKPSPSTSASFLRNASKDPSTYAQDNDGVIEMWELINAYLVKLLSPQNGLLAEIIDFWDSTQSFISGQKQKLLPTGFEGQSREHHRLSDAGVQDLQKGLIELVNLVKGAILALFADPPIEDISLLLSPTLPNSPNTPASAAALSPRDNRFGSLNAGQPPPPSPKKGEPWEEFAFWPPYSNSLSAVHYLSKFLVLVGTAASEMTSMNPSGSGTQIYEKLKTLVSGSRERCVRAVLAAWNNDAENCKNVEDWTRSAEKRDQTKMPQHFVALESSVLSGLQKILYISEAMAKSGTSDVISPPPAKLLQMVRTQFVTSIYKALSGMVENAEKALKTSDDEWIVVTQAMASTALDASTSDTLTANAIDASNRNVRMLLTLSNLKALRVDYVPQLISLFESSFSVKLTEESKTIRDVLGQIDARLFASYTRPTISSMSSAIKAGIASPDWPPTTNRPDQVRPYVYSTMLSLVLVHTEVSTTCSSSNTSSSSTTFLLAEILSYLLEQISQSLLDAFKERPKYSLPALMQATLDTEFIAQTMSQYATDKASQIQSQIYLELDRRTNNDARTRLQSELGDMRGVLKRLREGTKSEFACFKKPRGERGGARAERKMTG